MSPTVICATSGGANNSSQQAVFAYVFSLMICSAICVDECSVYATVYLVMQVYMSELHAPHVSPTYTVHA